MSNAPQRETRVRGPIADVRSGSAYPSCSDDMNRFCQALYGRASTPSTARLMACAAVLMDGSGTGA